MKDRLTWRPYVITLLCIFTAGALALSSATMCKYTAGAAVQAGGTVAKWAHAPVWTTPTSNQVARIYANITSVDNRLQTNADWTFSIKNSSEVAVDYTPYLYAYDTDDKAQRAVAGPNANGTGATDGVFPYAITYSCTGGTRQGTTNTYRVAPSGTATFKASFSQTATALNSNSTHRCRFYVLAEQVD